MIHGFDICKAAEAVETGAQDKPLVPVKISDCGELSGESKLSAEDANYLRTYLERPSEEETPEDKRVEI